MSKQVLVIDDKRRNIESAKETLGKREGIDLVTASSINEAYELLYEESFDIVATDLKMPVGSFTGSMNTERYSRPNRELPAGLVFAARATNQGAKVVICTDSDHHRDWICALLDLVGEPYGDEDPYDVNYVEARSVSYEGYWDPEKEELIQDDRYWENDLPPVKDWEKALEKTGILQGAESSPSFAP